MAFRRVATRALLRRRPLGGIRYMGGSGGYVGMELPRASDVSVKVNLQLHGGEQRSFIGRVGDTMTNAAAANGVDELGTDDFGGGATTDIVHNDTWTEQLFGEGPQSVLSHVILTEEWAAKVPAPLSGEAKVLSGLDADERKSNSRIASEIRLTKELDGITCFVPPQPPSNIP